MDHVKVETVIKDNLNYYLSFNRPEGTQKDFAKFVDVSPPTVNDWLKGKSMPLLNKVDRICEYLCISRYQLFTERRDGLYSATLGENEYQVLNKYSSLNIDGQEKLRDYLDMLYDSGRYEKGNPLKTGRTTADVS